MTRLTAAASRALQAAGVALCVAGLFAGVALLVGPAYGSAAK
jgi:hypothetical protein